eukprot:1157922-Pelagomonas_calceolata.AAC.14
MQSRIRQRSPNAQHILFQLTRSHLLPGLASWDTIAVQQQPRGKSRHWSKDNGELRQWRRGRDHVLMPGTV